VTRRWLALAAAALLVAGCAGLDRSRGRPSRAEVDRLIAAMVDDTLDAVAPGAPRAPGVHDGTTDECTNNLGAYDGTFKSTISRQVTGLSEAAVAAAEQRVTRLWRDRNLVVQRYQGPPGVVDLQAEQRGVEYVARISRLGHRVTAWGTTPCLRPDRAAHVA
jgi:hypothetical protein